MQRSPLTPSDCDLRSEQFLPLCAAHWRDHALAFDSNAEAFRAAVLLAMASWSQVPCASLPNDDAALAVMAGLGRTKRSMSQWLKMKGGVLADWVLCEDNRWYHQKVAEQALAVWERRLQESAQRKRSAQRTSKTREEARTIRAALSELGVKTNSLQPLHELRELALANGLMQFQPIISLVPRATNVPIANQAVQAQTDSELHHAATGTYGSVPAQARQTPTPCAQSLDLFASCAQTEQHQPFKGNRRQPAYPIVNYEEFVDIFHEEMPKNPRIAILSEKRRKAIRSIWQQSSTLEVAPFNGFNDTPTGMAAWRKFFRVCNAASFLRGDGPPNAQGRRFCPTLDFFLKLDNVIKALEGRYHAEGE
tara:strand:- start:2211 stop:3305 length:1095 start_codon:yes stop_codon:yes gene_type:complete